MPDTPVVGTPKPPDATVVKPPAATPQATPPQSTATPQVQANPTLTSKNLPPQIPPPRSSDPPEITIEGDADIVAKPLMSPDFTKLKPTNPAMCLRLVNRLALGGQRFEEAKIQGFICCKPGDVQGMTDVFAKKDGVVTYGDVIVMMMPRLDYLGAIKNNEQNARKRVRKAAAMGTAQEQLTSALNEVPGSRENKSKIKLFQPERD